MSAMCSSLGEYLTNAIWYSLQVSWKNGREKNSLFERTCQLITFTCVRFELCRLNTLQFCFCVGCVLSPLVILRSETQRTCTCAWKRTANARVESQLTCSITCSITVWHFRFCLSVCRLVTRAAAMRLDMLNVSWNGIPSYSPAPSPRGRICRGNRQPISVHLDSNTEIRTKWAGWLRGR